MRLVSGLVAAALVAVPARAAVPDPEKHFGHAIGADRTVLDWERVASYFQALEAAAPERLQVRELGKSTEGRPFLAAIFSSPENLKKLDRYREIQRRLADPRITPEAEAEKLIGEGKAVVMITCSIHATEIASTHTAVEFAWRLLTEDKPRFRNVLNNTIFILVPSLNPDGVDIVTRWYRKTLGTPYESTSPPELYHKYVGHDNNRDWYIFSQPETRLTVSELHNVWHPHIVYDVHQMGQNAARIFVPPWLDPVEPNIDPLIVQQCNRVGAAMAADLTAAGKPGVVVNAMYDFWTPARHYQAYHGGLRILSESASARIATPVTIRPEQLDRTALGYDATSRTWNYVEPWQGGEWRLRDIIDYQLIAWESCLYEAAVHREDLLRNFYRIGRRAVERKSPYAFVVPAGLRDPGAARKLLETLAFGLVEIERAVEAFEADGKRFSAGSHVIRMQQPYSAWAKTLLERQQYPDLRLYPGGPPKRPYDVTAHTLPLLMGVAVEAITAPFSARLERVTRFESEPPPSGVLPASDTETWRAVNRIWKSGGVVWRDSAAGDFLTAPVQGRGLRELRRPRIALYKSYVPSMDEGWTRWLLEQFGFEYTSVFDRDVRAGELRQRFDVLVFPDQRAPAIAEGHKPGAMPPEFTGGLGEKGEAALKQFAGDGGTLVFLNHASEYGVEHLGLPVKTVTAGLSNQEFYSPGSLLNVMLDPSHPLAYGLPPEMAIWSEGSPAWELGPDVRGQVVARYPQSGVLASGWLLGEKYLGGRSALLDLPLGRGRVMLFGLRPQYRAQSYQAFKLFFNALLHTP